jgi:hypothetical protein
VTLVLELVAAGFCSQESLEQSAWNQNPPPHPNKVVKSHEFEVWHPIRVLWCPLPEPFFGTTEPPSKAWLQRHRLPLNHCRLESLGVQDHDLWFHVFIRTNLSHEPSRFYKSHSRPCPQEMTYDSCWFTRFTT